MFAYTRFSSRQTRLLGRVARGLAYGVAALLPAAASFGLILGRINASIGVTAAPASAPGVIAQPAYDPAKPVVAVLLGNTGTEITDLLGPYEIFAASGAFNVYAVAPERRPAPILNSAQADSGLDVMPHFSFAEFARLRAAPPDVIVIPYIRAYQSSPDHAIVDWIRQHAGPKTLVVSICAGALLLADTGLLDGRPATIHWSTIALAQRLYPNVGWRRGERYVESGNIISSAGVTAGIDASLAAVRRLAGEETARAVAARLAYPHTAYLDTPAYRMDPFGVAGQLQAATNAALPWERATLGALLFGGIDEIALSAVLDTYQQSQLISTQTVAAERGLVQSRHGLLVLPRHDLRGARGYERLIVPGDAVPPAAAPALQAWARERGVAIETLATIAGGPGRYPFDVTIADLARRQSRTLARLTSQGLEYPIGHLGLANIGWQRIPLRAAALLAAGLFLALGLKRLFASRRRAYRVVKRAAAA